MSECHNLKTKQGLLKIIFNHNLTLKTSKTVDNFIHELSQIIPRVLSKKVNGYYNNDFYTLMFE